MFASFGFSSVSRKPPPCPPGRHFLVPGQQRGSGGIQEVSVEGTNARKPPPCPPGRHFFVPGQQRGSGGIQEVSGDVGTKVELLEPIKALVAGAIEESIESIVVAVATLKLQIAAKVVISTNRNVVRILSLPQNATALKCEFAPAITINCRIMALAGQTRLFLQTEHPQNA